MSHDPTSGTRLVLHVEGRSWPLNDGEIIGRLGTVGGEALRGHDVLSRQHLRVDLTPAGWQVTLIPTAGNETLCNGIPMRSGQPVSVTDACEIRVVTLTLRLVAHAERDAGHPAALLTLDEDLRLEWRNEAAGRLLRHELPVGTCFLDLLETGATLRLRHALMALREGAELDECEIAINTQDGSPWIAVCARRSGGKLLLALRDITLQRQHRASVRQAAGRLDAKVGALTAILTARPFVEGDLAAALPLLTEDAAALLENTTVTAWLPLPAAPGRAEDSAQTLCCRAAAGAATTPVGKKAVLSRNPDRGEVPPAMLAALQTVGILDVATASAWLEPIDDHGLLVFQRPDAARPWLEPEARLIGLAVALGKQLFANMQRSEAMKTLRLREESLSAELAEAAHYVERRLPAVLDEGHVRVDWIYQPCGRLGGDTFGYEWLDDDRFAIYIADVMGHGSRSSLHALSLSQTLKLLLARGAGDDPAAWLAALNREFPMKSHEGLLWTMWCGIYDRRTLAIRHASGGHPPALLCHPGKVEELSSAGPVLGAMEDAPYQSAIATVPDGAKLFLYTDGAYEFPIAGDDTGTLADFVQAVASSAGMETGECAYLRTRAAALCTEPDFPDDFTIVRARFAR